LILALTPGGNGRRTLQCHAPLETRQSSGIARPPARKDIPQILK
jgi:hypothetical protein